jgi:hypothetical protein
MCFQKELPRISFLNSRLLPDKGETKKTDHRICHANTKTASTIVVTTVKMTAGVQHPRE